MKQNDWNEAIDNISDDIIERYVQNVDDFSIMNKKKRTVRRVCLFSCLGILILSSILTFVILNDLNNNLSPNNSQEIILSEKNTDMVSFKPVIIGSAFPERNTPVATVIETPHFTESPVITATIKPETYPPHTNTPVVETPQATKPPVITATIAPQTFLPYTNTPVVETPQPTKTPAPVITKAPTATQDNLSGLDYDKINSKSRAGKYYYVIDNGVHKSLYPEHSSCISKYDGIVKGDKNQKVIYLTFNMGDEHGYTKEALEILSKYNAKATFFCLGDYVKSNPSLVKQIHSEGHLLANHGNHHIMAANGSTDAAISNINDFYTVLKNKTGITLNRKFYRPPSGFYSERDLEIARQLGITSAFWSVAYKDYSKTQGYSNDYILNLLKSNLSNGAIYQLHLTNPGNANFLEEFITYAISLGYSFETL
jgi:peptidoglycan-N-acetylmuramic acid deacetylase